MTKFIAAGVILLRLTGELKNAQAFSIEMGKNCLNSSDLIRFSFGATNQNKING